MLSIAVGVFGIVCLWMMFEKAGLPGWGAVIPFYNLYIMCKTFRPKIKGINTFLIYIIMTVLLTVTVILFATSITLAVYYNDSSNIGLILLYAFLMLIAIAMLIVANCFLFSGVSKAFGQPTSFTVGLVLVPVVFIAIIAFNKNIRFIGNDTVNTATDNAENSFTNMGANNSTGYNQANSESVDDSEKAPIE